MKRMAVPLMIGGLVAFIVGIVLLAQGGIGVLVMLLGIGCLLFGSVLLMGTSGSVNQNYFDNGYNSCTDQASTKYNLEREYQEQHQG